MPTLLESLKAFSDKIVTAIDHILERVTSVKKIKREQTFREACIKLKYMTDNAYSFVGKVDDLFLYGPSEARLKSVKEAIGSNNFDPQSVASIVSSLQTYLKEAELLYAEFHEASKGAHESCVRASQTCRHKYSQAKRDKLKTQADGKAAANRATAIGTTASVVAFVPTLGLGTIVGAVATHHAVSTIKTATANKVFEYEKLAKDYQQLDTDLDELKQIATTMDEQASKVHYKLELFQEYTEKSDASLRHVTEGL